MNDATVVLRAITEHPGLRFRALARRIECVPLARVEDAIWQLWVDGKIQIAPDSTIRLTREGEKIFRHIL